MEVAEALAPGDEVVGMCEGGNFKYYQIEIEDTTQLLVITYLARRADPDNENSDPDIYVSNQTDKVTQGND